MATFLTDTADTFLLDGKTYAKGYRIEPYGSAGVLLEAHDHDDRPGAGTFLPIGRVTINGTLATTVSQLISLLTPVVENGASHDEWWCDYTVDGMPSGPSIAFAQSAATTTSTTTGTAVGTASISNPESGKTYTYSLLDNAGGAFAINASTGVVTVASALTPGALSITIRALATSAGTFYRLSDGAVVAYSSGAVMSSSVASGPELTLTVSINVVLLTHTLYRFSDGAAFRMSDGAILQSLG